MWPFSWSKTKKNSETPEEQLESVVIWVRGLGPVSTGKLAMHGKLGGVRVPTDVAEAVKANPDFFVPTNGWEKFCERVAKNSALPGVQERCDGSGTNEWGNTLRSLLLKSAGLSMNVKKENWNAGLGRLSGKK